MMKKYPKKKSIYLDAWMKIEYAHDYIMTHINLWAHRIITIILINAIYLEVIIANIIKHRLLLIIIFSCLFSINIIILDYFLRQCYSINRHDIENQN